MMDVERLYTADEVANRFKVKRRTVWGWCRKGFISHKRVGYKNKLIRFSDDDLKEFEKKRYARM